MIGAVVAGIVVIAAFGVTFLLIACLFADALSRERAPLSEQQAEEPVSQE